MFRRWRRIDQPGLELVRIDIGKHGVIASSTLVDGGPAPFSMRSIWTLDPEWRTRALRIEHMNGEDRWMTIERTGEASWSVDRQPADRLAGCREIDLSATPFSKSLAIRLLGGGGELTIAYLDAGDLSIRPSRQVHERLNHDMWRYADLGPAAGFPAALQVDPAGLVKRYEGLFEALEES